MSFNFSIKAISEEEFMPLFRKHKDELFGGDHSYVLWDLLSDEDLETTKRLDKNMGTPFKLFLAAFDQKDNFIGWSWGMQSSKTDFYMVNSGVLEDFRRKGVYSKLLEKAVAECAKEGFQVIYSRHCATNNAVIIPKLKAGFIISSMEINDNFGVLIHLRLYTNQTRKKIMDYRSGQLAPTPEIKTLFYL